MSNEVTTRGAFTERNAFDREKLGERRVSEPNSSLGSGAEPAIEAVQGRDSESSAELLPESSAALRAESGYDRERPGGVESSFDQSDSSYLNGGEWPSSQSIYRDPAVARAKLAMAPLSALLPRLGELTPLVNARSNFEERLRILHAQAEARATEERLNSIASEEGMINQALQWLSLQGETTEGGGTYEYSEAELISLYELGRLYYEVGYYGPGERVFSGLIAVTPHWGGARLGGGVVKLERGLFEEAGAHFRAAARDPQFILEAKVGLSAVFLARGETERAASMLGDIRREVEQTMVREEVQLLWRALARRCSADPGALGKR